MRGRRLGAVVAAALIAVSLPPAPAAAQPAQAGEPDSMATPPPLEPNFPVPSGTAPDIAYERKVDCITSAPGKQTDLKNKPWGQLEMQFDELHTFSRGEGVLVGVIDTGVNGHNWLKARGGGDYVKTDERNGMLDCDGHGTEVAGIIAANPPKDSGIGFTGIAPGAEILSIRQSSANYRGQRQQPNGQTQEEPAGTLDTLAQAVVSAAEQGVKVINMSVDSCRPVAAGPISQAEKNLQSALRYAFEQKDVVLVASAGNNGEDCAAGVNTGNPERPSHLVLPPWFSEYVISVAAVKDNGDPAEFSIPGPWVTVAAPGTEIISLDPTDPSGLVNQQFLPGQQQAQQIQGTSFAAPYVAGLAALIRSYHKGLDARAVMDRITSTALHPAAPGGRDNRIGYGMINPMAALTATIPSELGIEADENLNVRAVLPPPNNKNWAPTQVAIIGAAGAVVLLLLTLFVVHTVRRNRRGSEAA
ncbi:type VII secretion-associated serine protease mycosin [Actinokineospora sp. G85]|uniref:type VII secretion-associated serine protease mycosin n=1 Tax=Actinokineospora sp. G85 TaxID=3406626 RepID=UPI003C71ACAA